MSEPSGNGTSADGVIDVQVLSRLAEGTGGDERFVTELIEQFVADAPGFVSAARAGLESGDVGEVRRAAHTLKSNAATFGATRLVETSRALEDVARRGELFDGDSLVDAMASELERVLRGLPEVWRATSSG